MKFEYLSVVIFLLIVLALFSPPKNNILTTLNPFCLKRSTTVALGNWIVGVSKVIFILSIIIGAIACIGIVTIPFVVVLLLIFYLCYIKWPTAVINSLIKKEPIGVFKALVVLYVALSGVFSIIDTDSATFVENIANWGVLIFDIPAALFYVNAFRWGKISKKFKELDADDNDSKTKTPAPEITMEKQLGVEELKGE